MKSVREAKHNWLSEDGETYFADFDYRIRMLTWPFGEIHQCKLLVRYNHAKVSYEGIGPAVGLGLEAQKSQRRAMRYLAQWASEVANRQPLTVRQFIRTQRRKWPRMFATEELLIQHVFMTIGNGYDWLDGEIVPNSFDSVETEASIKTKFEKNLELKLGEADKEINRTLRLLKKAGAGDLVTGIQERHKRQADERKAEDAARKKWRGPYHRVWPEWCLISEVPDDVLPDWLDWAYKAARLLRDDDAPGALKVNNTTGRQIIARLEHRFPRLTEQPRKRAQAR